MLLRCVQAGAQRKGLKSYGWARPRELGRAHYRQSIRTAKSIERSIIFVVPVFVDSALESFSKVASQDARLQMRVDVRVSFSDKLVPKRVHRSAVRRQLERALNGADHAIALPRSERHSPLWTHNC